jgi:hypothetical protein
MSNQASRDSFTDWYDREHPEDKHQDCAVSLAFSAWCAAIDDSDSVLASTLISHLCLSRGRPVEWREAIEITAFVTKMPEEEKQRLLDMEGY